MGKADLLIATATREDLAWAAGFFDGEGSFPSFMRQGKSKRGGLPCISASITNTDRDLIEKFSRIVGMGRIDVHTREAGNRKTAYRWQVQRIEFIQALGAALWPWLGEYKRRRWQNALRLYRDNRRPNAVEMKRAQTTCLRGGHPLVRRGTQRYCPTCDRERSRARA